MVAGAHSVTEGEEQVVIKWMGETGLEAGRKMEVITVVEDGKETETEIETATVIEIENGIGIETETGGTGGRSEASIATGNVGGAMMQSGSEQGGREQKGEEEKEEAAREAEELKQKVTGQGGRNGARGPHAGTRTTV